MTRLRSREDSCCAPTPHGPPEWRFASARSMGRMAPGRTHIGACRTLGSAISRSNETSGCMNVSSSVEGRNTPLGQLLTQSRHDVQCFVKLAMLRLPGGVMRVRRTGFPYLYSREAAVDSLLRPSAPRFRQEWCSLSETGGVTCQPTHRPPD